MIDVHNEAFQRKTTELTCLKAVQTQWLRTSPQEKSRWQVLDSVACRYTPDPTVEKYTRFKLCGPKITSKKKTFFFTDQSWHDEKVLNFFRINLGV